MPIARSLQRVFSSARDFRRDRRGATTIMVAASMTAILGAGALAVDVGWLYYTKRRAQAAVDLAAIAGAGSLPNYSDIVKANLAENGFGFDGQSKGNGGGDVIMSALQMTPGIYTADASIPVKQRFQPSDANVANALRVTMTRDASLFFGRAITGQSAASYQVTSTASTATSAAFSVGSRLVKLDGGVANAILSGLLGTSVSLSVMDYNALATAKIEMFPFLDALGDELNIRAGSYNNLLEANGVVGKTYSAAANILAKTGQTSAANALRKIASSNGAAKLSVKLRDIIDLGPRGTSAIGTGPAVAAQFDALSLLTTSAQLANGTRQVAVNLGVSLPGIASATLTLGIGERPVKGVWLGIGRAGAEAHTAQTRLLLEIKLLGNGALPAGIRLPVYVELAAADARLANVRCRANPADTRVDIDARPGVVDAWIGDVGMAQFTNMTSPVNPPAAQLVSLLGVTVTGRAHATMSNIAYDRLTYTVDDIRNGKYQTVRTRDFTTSLTTKLLGDLQLKTQVAGIPLIDLTLLTKSVVALIQPVTPSVDTLLSNILTTLGIGLGEADVWANGVRCDGGVLVN